MQGDLVKARVQAENIIDWSDISPEMDDADAIAVQVIPGQMDPPIRGDGTSSSQIVVNWTAPANDGGSSIISYNLQYDQGTSGVSWTDLTGVDTDYTSLSTTVSDVSAGGSYLFRVRAENLQGFGEFSNTETIEAVQAPDDIANPVTTSIVDTSVKFTWDAPFNGGQTITSYTLEVKEGDSDYSVPSGCTVTASFIAGEYY